MVKKTIKKSEEDTVKDKKVSAAPKAVKVKKVEEKVQPDFSGEYLYAVGRRKTSIAQVRLYSTKKEENIFSVNGKNLTAYVSLKRLQGVILSPLVSAGQEGKFNVSVKVSGGGINAQAEAIRLGISRALIKSDENFRKILKSLGFLTRDARIVERKKPGKRKARRSPQWAKR